MDLKNFQNILLKHGYEHNYYEIIFNLLSHPNEHLNTEDRKELFEIIQDEIFYNYSYTWHLREGKTTVFLNQLHSFNQFHKSNYELHNTQAYQHFLGNNFTTVLQKELELFFTKGLLLHKEYDDYEEREKDTVIHFFSPLGLYNLIKGENIFNDLVDKQIINNLLAVENHYSQIKNPILQEGLNIVEQSLHNPTYFKNFISFWQKYKKLLLTSNTPENDLDIIEKVAPELYQQYINYMSTPSIDYNFDKTVLSKKVTEFYFTYFEDFISYAGKIPNPLVWIHESKNFLSTQKHIDNMQEKHFEYFKHFNDSSFFDSFIANILFSQRFEAKTAYKNVQNILSKNFNFENLFLHFKYSNESSEGLSNFENYLISLNKKFNQDDLLILYRKHHLNHQLVNNNNLSKKIKI